MKRTILVGAAVLGTLALAACGGDSGGSGGSGGNGGNGGNGKKADCGKATDDCTPRVGPNGKVRVDALVWRVRGAETAKSIGDTSLGLGEKANGTFLIVKLKVTSRKDESATLSDETIQLDAGGTTYKPDNDGTVAAIGAGENPLFFEDIGPDSTLTSQVVYDVPNRVLRKKNLQVRFNELGFGETHGFIRLPASVAR